jgi:hypothetical protein
MKLKKYITQKVNKAKEKNGWKRISKKRLEIVFSGNAKKNLKQAIKRHSGESLSNSEKEYISTFQQIGLIRPPKKITTSPTPPVVPISKTPTVTRKPIYTDEILFWELLDDLETAFTNLNLKYCYIIGQNGSYSASNVAAAIKEARSTGGEMKAYKGDYINNVTVDVYVVSYNGIKTDLEIQITDSWEYERPKKTKK